MSELVKISFISRNPKLFPAHTHTLFQIVVEEKCNTHTILANLSMQNLQGGINNNDVICIYIYMYVLYMYMQFTFMHACQVYYT